MHLRRRWSIAVAASVLVAGLAGCDQVSSTADKASTCADALRIAGFTPDMSNPAKAVKDAHDRAKQISDLANKVGDENVQDALKDLSGSLDNAKPADFDPKQFPTWAQHKLDSVNALAKACS